MAVLDRAIEVKGDFEARMWSISKENLEKKNTPILVVDIQISGYSESDVYEIQRISKIPQFGKEYEKEILAKISEKEVLEERINGVNENLYSKINRSIAKHCHGNKIYISEMANESIHMNKD